MNSKILLAVIGSCGIIGRAHAGDPVACMDCTLNFETGSAEDDRCTTRDPMCCPPCNIVIDPGACDETLCNGEIVTDMGNGCDKIATSGCVGSLCNTVFTARCQQGYYGTATLNRTNTSCSGCTRCPSTDDGLYGTTSGPGATEETECYIPTGNAFGDISGSGVYTGNCHYSGS